METPEVDLALKAQPMYRIMFMRKCLVSLFKRIIVSGFHTCIQYTLIKSIPTASPQMSPLSQFHILSLKKKIHSVHLASTACV